MALAHTDFLAALRQVGITRLRHRWPETGAAFRAYDVAVPLTEAEAGPTSYVLDNLGSHKSAAIRKHAIRRRRAPVPTCLPIRQTSTQRAGHRQAQDAIAQSEAEPSRANGARSWNLLDLLHTLRMRKLPPQRWIFFHLTRKDSARKAGAGAPADARNGSGNKVASRVKVLVSWRRSPLSVAIAAGGYVTRFSFARTPHQAAKPLTPSSQEILRRHYLVRLASIGESPEIAKSARLS